MKKYLWIPLAVAGIAVVFLVVSIMVSLSRGRSSWIRHKLKIGGMLLVLTAFYGSGCSSRAERTCYSQPVFIARIEMYHQKKLVTKELILEAGKKYSLLLKMIRPKYGRFVYQLRLGAEIVDRGRLNPLNKENKWINQHTLVLEKNLKPGLYRLLLESRNFHSGYFIRIIAKK